MNAYSIRNTVVNLAKSFGIKVNFGDWRLKKTQRLFMKCIATNHNRETFQSECVSDYGRENMRTNHTAISQPEFLQRSFAFDSVGSMAYLVGVWVHAPWEFEVVYT